MYRQFVILFRMADNERENNIENENNYIQRRYGREGGGDGNREKQVNAIHSPQAGSGRGVIVTVLNAFVCSETEISPVRLASVWWQVFVVFAKHTLAKVFQWNHSIHAS